jgi:hypothetical protein
MFPVAPYPQGVRVWIDSGERKYCVLHLPTDEQLCDHMRARRVIKHYLGRGKTITKTPNAARCDSELFEKLVVEGHGEEFDEAERSLAINKLLRTQVTDVQREGNSFRVTLDTPFGETTHVLSMPKQKDVTEYRHEIVSSVEGRRQEEIRFKLEPANRLYDTVLTSVEGYDGAVPVNHKSTVLTEILGSADDTEEELPEVEALEIG